MKQLFTIVGMQHRPGAREVMARLRAGDLVLLQRDHNNEYDRYAVQVWGHDHHVGFIKGSEVEQLAKFMDRGCVETLAAKYVVDGSRWPQVELELTT